MGTYNNCLVVANACNADTLCQQFYAYDYSNFTFSADYDFPGAIPGKAWGNSICQNTRGNLVLLASDIEGFSSVDDDLALIEINKTGQIIKQAIVYTYGDEMPKKIIPVGPRGYIILSQNIPFSKGVISFTDTAFTGIHSFAGTNLLVNDAYATNDSSIFIAASHSPFGMLLKLDKYLNVIWSKRFISAKEIRRITLLNDGNLLLSGKSSTSNAYMCKLNPATGQVIWSKTYSSFSGTDGYQTEEDDFGNLYLTGNAAGSPYRSFILKTDQNGVMQWQRLFSTTTSLVGNYCAVNQFDDLYFFHYSNTIPNYITKLDLAGNVKWTKDYDIRADGTTITPTAAVMCMDGGIAITGTSAFGPNEDIFVIKTDTSGITNSCNVSIPPITMYTAGITETTNTVDSTINFGITYTSFSYLSGTMLYTPDIVCYGNSCAGMVNYTYTNTGLAFNFDQDAFGFPDMIWDFGDGTTSTTQDPSHTFPSTGIYTVCLSANVPGCGLEMNCQNINVILTNVQEDNQETDINVYPNPFTNEFNLNYVLKEKSSITLEIYNAIGQKMETIVNSDQVAGEYKYSFNAQQNGLDAGIYFVKFSLNGKSTIKKVVAVK
jgi:PKD repeat protein